MFCKSCGRQIDNDSAFCSFCGTKQSNDLKPQVQVDTNQFINTAQKVYSNETNFSNSPNIVRQPKYDPTYKKEDDAIIVGINLLVIALIFNIVGLIIFEDRESYELFRAATAIVSLILRIFITGWVVNIAKRQNRQTFGWGLFAFFLPPIALIVIATRKKIFANIQIVEGLDNEQNSKVLSDKAQEFYNESKYSESIRFSEKAIELNQNNEIATDILKKSKVAIARLNNVGSSTQTVFSEIDFIYNINKRVTDCVENQFKDLVFLRGVIMTLSMMPNYRQLLEQYKIIFGEDLCNEIKQKCPESKKSNYILEPLINKGITQKI